MLDFPWGRRSERQPIYHQTCSVPICVPVDLYEKLIKNEREQRARDAEAMDLAIFGRIQDRGSLK